MSNPTQYRCISYDPGGLRIADEVHPAEGLGPQGLADKLGEAALEGTQVPFTWTILVWDASSAAEPPLWLHKFPAADDDAVIASWRKAS